MAVTTVTSGLNQQKGITYTVITDSSADWGSVSNDTYFYDLGDGLPHYKDATGTVVSIFESSGNTIYSADDVLTGNRIVDLGGYGLTFEKSSTPTQYTKIYRNGGLEVRGSGFDTANDVFKVKYRTSGNDLLSVGQNGGFTLDSSINMGQFNATWNYGQRFSDGYISFLNGANWNDNEQIRFDFRNNTNPSLTFLRNASGSAGNRFIVRGTGLIETNHGTSKEQISLQGNTLIKGDTGTERTPYNFKIVNSSGNDTFVVNNNQSSEFYGNDTLSTSTALAIYDGDTTPSKLWDFRNNGDLHFGTSGSPISPIIEVNGSVTYNFPATSAGQFIVDGSSQTASDSILFEVKSVGTGNSFNIDQKGEIDSTGITGTNILNIRNSSDTLGLNIKSGVSLFHVTQMLTRGAEAYSNGIRQVFSSTTEEMKWQQASSSDFNHQIKSGTVAGSNEVRFFNKGWSNSDGFVIGASTLIGTEQISLQGETLIDGTLDMNNNRITNAVINPSVQETTSTATFTINADQETMGVLTAMAAATTIAAPTGTPVQGQKLMLRFKDDGTSRALTWNAIWRAIGVTLPTATTASKTLYIGTVYNSTDTKWDVIAVKEEA